MTLTLTSDEWANFIYLSILLALLLSNFIFAKQIKASQFLKQISFWLIIICLSVVAYSLRYDFYNLKQRLFAELFPSEAIRLNDQQIAIRASSDGHFYVNLKINNIPIKFMVDTGASDIVLNFYDAKNSHINLKELAFNRRYQTANGVIFGAGVIVKKIELENLVFHNLSASVNKVDMGVSLLGVSFLRQFKKYEFYQDQLILTY